MRIYSKDYQRGVSVDGKLIDIKEFWGVLPFDTGVGKPMCAEDVIPVTANGAKAFVERERKAGR